MFDGWWASLFRGGWGLHRDDEECFEIEKDIQDPHPSLSLVLVFFCDEHKPSVRAPLGSLRAVR